MESSNYYRVFSIKHLLHVQKWRAFCDVYHAVPSYLGFICLSFWSHERYLPQNTVFKYSINLSTMQVSYITALISPQGYVNFRKQNKTIMFQLRDRASHCLNPAESEIRLPLWLYTLLTSPTDVNCSRTTDPPCLCFRAFVHVYFHCWEELPE